VSYHHLVAFFVKRKLRPFRSDGESLPNTVVVLLVGSPHCGKSTLMQLITAQSEDDSCGDEPCDSENENGNVNDIGVDEPGQTFIRTTTVAFETLDDEEAAVRVPRTIVYVELSEAQLHVTLTNASSLARFDVVLFAYDSSDAYGCSYWMEKHRLILRTNRKAVRQNQIPAPTHNATSSQQQPFLVVRMKSDLDSVVQLAGHSVRKYCKQHRLLWPAVSVSAAEGFIEHTDTLMLNEYVMSVAETPELAITEEEITAMRKVRRVFISMAALSIIFYSVRGLVRLARWRPSRKPS